MQIVSFAQRNILFLTFICAFESLKNEFKLVYSFADAICCLKATICIVRIEKENGFKQTKGKSRIYFMGNPITQNILYFVRSISLLYESIKESESSRSTPFFITYSIPRFSFKEKDGISRNGASDDKDDDGHQGDNVKREGGVSGNRNQNGSQVFEGCGKTIESWKGRTNSLSYLL